MFYFFSKVKNFIVKNKNKSIFPIIIFVALIILHYLTPTIFSRPDNEFASLAPVDTIFFTTINKTTLQIEPNKKIIKETVEMFIDQYFSNTFNTSFTKQLLPKISDSLAISFSNDNQPIFYLKTIVEIPIPDELKNNALYLPPFLFISTDQKSLTNIKKIFNQLIPSWIKQKSYQEFNKLYQPNNFITVYANRNFQKNNYPKITPLKNSLPENFAGSLVFQEGSILINTNLLQNDDANNFSSIPQNTIISARNIDFAAIADSLGNLPPTTFLPKTKYSQTKTFILVTDNGKQTILGNNDFLTEWQRYSFLITTESIEKINENSLKSTITEKLKPFLSEIRVKTLPDESTIYEKYLNYNLIEEDKIKINDSVFNKLSLPKMNFNLFWQNNSGNFTITNNQTLLNNDPENNIFKTPTCPFLKNPVIFVNPQLINNDGNSSLLSFFQQFSKIIANSNQVCITK